MLYPVLAGSVDAFDRDQYMTGLVNSAMRACSSMQPVQATRGQPLVRLEKGAWTITLDGRISKLPEQAMPLLYERISEQYDVFKDGFGMYECLADYVHYHRESEGHDPGYSRDNTIHSMSHTITSVERDIIDQQLIQLETLLGDGESRLYEHMTRIYQHPVCFEEQWCGYLASVYLGDVRGTNAWSTYVVYFRLYPRTDEGERFINFARLTSFGHAFIDLATLRVVDNRLKVRMSAYGTSIDEDVTLHRDAWSNFYLDR
jgi:hypothetical protein